MLILILQSVVPNNPTIHGGSLIDIMNVYIHINMKARAKVPCEWIIMSKWDFKGNHTIIHVRNSSII